jgi:predicted DNA-binding transcriptional regulator YafY
MARKKSKAAAKPKPSRRRKQRNTPESQRGGFFSRLIRAFFAVHRNCELAPGKEVSKPFSKKDMAEWLQDDFDRDMDETAAWYEALSKATGTVSPMALPPALQTVKEASRLRNAERAITSLIKAGFVFHRTDEDGNPPGTKRKKRAKASAKKSSKKKAGSGISTEKAYWTYDPKGPVSRELVSLLSNFKLTGYELEGIVGCSTLLKELYDLPWTDAVNKLFARITKGVSTKAYNEILEQKDVWRYLFRRPGKYEPIKHLLQAWNDATILRNQCSMIYDTPGSKKPLNLKTVAAFGTIFSPEEDSIFLVGCEADRMRPGKWQRPILYKLDRVVGLLMLEIPNPPLTDIGSHDRVSRVRKRGVVDRLDLERLFLDSAGTFFHYGSTISLVVRVRDPHKMALCIEAPFHKAQKITAGPAKGEITITVDRCFEQEMIPRLLRLGDGFTVVEPPKMAAEIRRIANAIASQH